MTKMNKPTTLEKSVAVFLRSADSGTGPLRAFAEGKGWKIKKVYADEGADLGTVIREVGQGLFNVLLIPELTSIGSSLKDLINVLETLGRAGVDLVSMDEPGIDTARTGPDELTAVLRAVSKFQDKTRCRKIRQGLDKARAGGKALGPPVRLTEEVYEEALQLRREGHTFKEIGKKLRLNESTIRKRIKQDVASGMLDREPVKGEIKKLRVRLWLFVERNSKFVRGKKKVLEDIEYFVLPQYEMEKPDQDGHEYELKIPYENEEDLESTIYDLYAEMERTADMRNCFIDPDIIALDGSERSW